MPLQFALAVARDNPIPLKWLNAVLSKLGFAVNYKEGNIFHSILNGLRCWSLVSLRLHNTSIFGPQT